MKAMNVARSLSRSLSLSSVVPAALGLALAAGTGCSTVDKTAKTATADKLAEGHSEMSLTLDHGGQLQVWDNDTNKIVYQAEVKKHDKVVVDPKADKVLINGDTVAQPGMTPDHRYQVFLKQ
jgi:hypothetical protein